MGNPRAVRIFRDLLKSRNSDVVFLSETPVDSNVIKNLADKSGFYSPFAVDRIGRGGALAIMLKRSITCQIVDSSTNHIHVHIMERSNISWKLTCFYGYPDRNHHQESWDFLRRLADNAQVPWCIFDDFKISCIFWISKVLTLTLHPCLRAFV